MRPGKNSLTADASAKVTFSEATDTISAVYQMTTARVTASTPLSPDMQTQAMGALRSSGVSMNGIGSALLSALTQQRDDVTISVPASGGAQTDTQSAVGAGDYHSVRREPDSADDAAAGWRSGGTENHSR